MLRQVCLFATQLRLHCIPKLPHLPVLPALDSLCVSQRAKASISLTVLPVETAIESSKQPSCPKPGQ